MFLRRKKNRSGTTSIVVVQKHNGLYHEVKTIGTSDDISQIETLFAQGKQWISSHLGEQNMFDLYNKAKEERQVTEYLLSNIENILLNGTELILNQVFRITGFDAIRDTIFRQLVIARLSQPMSKAATVEYLKSHWDEDTPLHQIYRYLDKLHDTQQAQVQQISVEHTQRILGGKIGLLFYDVTTLYFEADYSDELRETGFSKDGKHSLPQIVLGLLASKEGYPLSYSIFSGSQYEGRTMLPVVEDFVQRFKLEDFVIVADSGLMNQKNIDLLESGNYQYIIGARIKNESNELKTWLLSLPKQDGVFHETPKGKARLIVGYSDPRAKKDRYNREKGIKRLEKEYRSGKITKQHINKRGYNKFLELTDDVKVAINHNKIKQDQQWDGLKGYQTNTTLSAQDVCEQYHGLWAIERAFRITKGTLELRPIFHFTPRRIQAHLCICFAAYKMYKELERVLKINHINMSVDKVLTIAKTITTIKINLPQSKSTLTKTMLLTPRHKAIAQLFDENFWKNF